MHKSSQLSSEKGVRFYSIIKSNTKLELTSDTVQGFEIESKQIVYKGDVVWEKLLRIKTHYPKRTSYEKIYFKLDLIFNTGRTDTLFLTHEERVRGISLDDKYPQFKRHIQDIRDHGWGDILVRD